MGLQDEDVGQVGTGILDAREYSSDTGRQVGKRVSKLYMNRAGNISTGLQLSNRRLRKHQGSCMFHGFRLGLRADGGVLASRS